MVDAESNDTLYSVIPLIKTDAVECYLFRQCVLSELTTIWNGYLAVYIVAGVSSKYILCICRESVGWSGVLCICSRSAFCCVVSSVMFGSC